MCYQYPRCNESRYNRQKIYLKLTKNKCSIVKVDYSHDRPTKINNRQKTAIKFKLSNQK